MPSKKRHITPEKKEEIRTKALEIWNRRSFADPTYDITFKMLLADKKLLKHFVNTLLNLEGEDEIKEIDFLPQELLPNRQIDQKVILDIRCKTNDDQKIIIEMQRQYKKYFIARMQYYMARLLVDEIKAGDSEIIHEKLKKTQILVISKDNLIKDKEYKQDTIYEQTVMPTVSERSHMEMFQNVMRWKFYELKKFNCALENGKVYSSQKVCEWLNFFNNCANIDYKGGIPEGIDDNIKEAYKMMEKTKLEYTGKLKEYIDEMVEDMFDRAEIEEMLEEACKKSRLEGKAEGRLEGKAEGRLEGKAEGIHEGELKGKLDLLQNLIQQGVSHEILLKSIITLTEEQVSKIEDHVHEHGISPVEDLMNLIAEAPTASHDQVI